MLGTYRLSSFEIARGSSLECGAIHAILFSFEAIDPELNRIGKTNLKRIVSMLTRLIQRTDAVSEQSIEYEYRDAKYEDEKKHEQKVVTDKTEPDDVDVFMVFDEDFDASQADSEVRLLLDHATADAHFATLRKVETNLVNYRLSASGFLAELDRMQLQVREYLSIPEQSVLVG